VEEEEEEEVGGKTHLDLLLLLDFVDMKVVEPSFFATITADDAL